MNGKNLATASLVCGILSLICIFFGYGSALGLILGIVGIVLSTKAKNAGFEEGLQKGGLIVSIIGTVLCGITFVACALCIGSLAALGASA